MAISSPVMIDMDDPGTTTMGAMGTVAVAAGPVPIRGIAMTRKMGKMAEDWIMGMAADTGMIGRHRHPLVNLDRLLEGRYRPDRAAWLRHLDPDRNYLSLLLQILLHSNSTGTALHLQGIAAERG